MGQFKVLAIKLLGGERERSSTYGIAELGGRKKILEKRKAIPVAVEIENLELQEIRIFEKRGTCKILKK